MAHHLGLEGVELLRHTPGGGTERVPAAEALADKTIGLYFSAHWCAPCRGFTPILSEVYEKVRKQHDDFEVLFVSADRSEEQFEEYFGTMPWLALPLGADEQRLQLSQQFSVRGIPRLVIVGKDGQEVAKDARAAVMRDREGAEFPWAGAAAPTGLAALLASPQKLTVIIMLLIWVYQWLFKKE